MKNNPLVVVHQPDFIPYLGFFQRLFDADKWVVLDEIQLSKNGWVHRDIIKTRYGKKWITVPIEKPSHPTPINQKRISYVADWQKNHLNLLKEAYKQATFFDEIFPYCEKLYAYKPELLVDFTMASIKILLELFDFDIPKIMGHTLKTDAKSNALVVEQVINAGGKRYLSGLGAKNYYDPAPFDNAGITVVWQEFQHPTYPQLHGEFIPMLSSLDIFFNCGIEGGRELLRRCSHDYSI